MAADVDVADDRPLGAHGDDPGFPDVGAAGALEPRRPVVGWLAKGEKYDITIT